MPLGPNQVLDPSSWVVGGKASEIVLEVLIQNLSLAVGLRVVCRACGEHRPLQLE